MKAGALWSSVCFCFMLYLALYIRGGRAPLGATGCCSEWTMPLISWSSSTTDVQLNAHCASFFIYTPRVALHCMTENSKMKIQKIHEPVTHLNHASKGAICGISSVLNALWVPLRLVGRGWILFFRDLFVNTMFWISQSKEFTLG